MLRCRRRYGGDLLKKVVRRHGLVQSRAVVRRGETPGKTGLGDIGQKNDRCADIAAAQKFDQIHAVEIGHGKIDQKQAIRARAPQIVRGGPIFRHLIAMRFQEDMNGIANGRVVVDDTYVATIIQRNCS